MGWWSTTIMGGDTPMDWECIFYDTLKIKMFKPKNGGYNKIPKKKLEESQDSLVRKINAMKKKGWTSQDIGLQVLGVTMMEAGAKINNKNKVLILDAAKKDGWAKEDEERRHHIDNFVLALQSYDGTKSASTTKEGLFEVIGKSMSEGKKGLVNINA
jgi:hypothetical protein